MSGESVWLLLCEGYSDVCIPPAVVSDGILPFVVLGQCRPHYLMGVIKAPREVIRPLVDFSKQAAPMEAKISYLLDVLLKTMLTDDHIGYS
jgi:hypothetical protein